MPLLVDDIAQLSQEAEELEKGALPPLYSFIITALANIVAFFIAFFFVFPGLRDLYGLGFLLAFFLSVGTFSPHFLEK
jgi:uncharacterized RDD family membrane protein YckC